MIKQSFLADKKWFNIGIGSSVVSYCEDCDHQRTHSCVDKSLVDGEWLYVFLCDYCRFGGI